MNGDNTRQVKKVKGKSNKAGQDNGQEEKMKQKRVTFGDFEEEEKVITSKKKNENSHAKRESKIDQHNMAEEENEKNLEFEDEFDDEWEEEVVDKDEEQVMDDQENEEEDAYDEEELTKKFGEIKFSDQPVIREYDNRGKKKKDDDLKAYLGTSKGLKEGEVLEFDNKAYDLYHRGQTEWPCLTLDILVPEHNKREIVQPSKVEIKEYPLTVHVVAGTQAPQPTDNAIYFMKWSQLHKTRFDDESQIIGEDDIEDNDEPELNVLSIKHPQAVNRIRSMNGSSIVALWDESGAVSIYDGTKHTQALAEYDEATNELLEGNEKIKLKAPKDTNKKNFLLSQFQHDSEGFALGWSPHTLGLFATGACDKKIYFYSLADENGSWVMDTTPFTAHKGSVEDLQFSPNNANLLASCSVDGTIKFIDFRTENRKKAEASIQVSDSDVNVLSWSAHAPNLIAAGADDGTIQVWDIRYLNKTRSVAEIQFHQEAITSIEFQPYEDSVITVASADNRVTVWDFSVEADMKSKNEEIPDQLMFIHQGLEDVKEIKHHPYMNELIVSTAGNGFNVFKPNYEEEDWEDDN